MAACITLHTYLVKDVSKYRNSAEDVTADGYFSPPPPPPPPPTPAAQWLHDPTHLPSCICLMVTRSGYVGERNLHRVFDGMEQLNHHTGHILE